MGALFSGIRIRLTLFSYPNTAQVASQQAKYIASMLQKLAVLDQEKKNIANSGLDEKEVQKALLPPFRFRNKGIVVSMGYPHAVVQFPNKYVMSNYLSYLLWKLVILYKLVSTLPFIPLLFFHLTDASLFSA